jgi:hypothetical protein
MSSMSLICKRGGRLSAEVNVAGQSARIPQLTTTFLLGAGTLRM